MATRRANLLLPGVTPRALGILAISAPVVASFTSRRSWASTSRAASRSSFARCRRRSTSSPKTTWTARSRSCGRASTSSASASREIRQQEADQISLQLPGISDPQKAADLVGKTAQPGSSTWQKNILGRPCRARGLGGTYPAPMDNLFQLLSSIQPQTKQGTPEEYYLVDPKAKKVILDPRTRRSGWNSAGWGSSRTREESSEASSRTAFPRTGSSSPAGIGERYCSAWPRPADPELPLPDEVRAGGPRKPGPGDDRRRPQARRHAPGLAGRRRRRPDGVHRQRRGQVPRDHSRAEARGQQIPNQGVPKEQALQSFAIVLDREIKSAPTIDWDDNPDGIAAAPRSRGSATSARP